VSLPRTFLCSGIEPDPSDPCCKGRRLVRLSAHGDSPNVHIVLQDLAKVFLKHLSPRLEDLLEIAAYVFAADCATPRTGAWSDGESAEPWEREFQFVIPVRDLEFWSKSEVTNLLIEALTFLSDDAFRFEFRELDRSKVKQRYLEFGQDEDWAFYKPKRVTMFSGGLDSLAGAVETASKGENLVLVSHRPVSTQSRRQTDLFANLQNAFPSAKMIHVPVWINKDKDKGKEHSQRTRSFLYSALGAVVSHSIQADGLQFFENGVVSLNFPVADEVIGARASRTTHPWALHLFERLYRQVLEREFVVDNPFLFKSKTEVVQLIADNGQAPLIRSTCSCAHQGFFQSKTQWHCGTCSQCIDRRVAILAGNLENNEDSHDYVIDVFTGPRKDGYAKNMAVNYARHATELLRMAPEQMAAKFNAHLTRAVRHLPKRSVAAQEFLDLHDRHAKSVNEVFLRQIDRHKGKMIDGTICKSSMLAMLLSQQHLVSSWRIFGDRITELVKKGLPAICQKEAPRNELRLQELIDGILKACDVDLVREFPFMRWGSGLTKPDWSNEGLRLWVEAKYPRKKEGLAKITDAVAADITKYGDSQRHVLFLVYDPERLIVDEAGFSEPIRNRPDMQIVVIR
jgi:hypothetical protein